MDNEWYRKDVRVEPRFEEDIERMEDEVDLLVGLHWRYSHEMLEKVVQNPYDHCIEFR